MRYRRMLAQTVDDMNIPLGFTLTIWSSGAIAEARFGFHTVTEALLLISGAIVGYLVCAGLASRQLGGMATLHVRAISVINVFAIVAAISVSAVSHLAVSSFVGYFLAGFVSTLVYISSISAFPY